MRTTWTLAVIFLLASIPTDLLGQAPDLAAQRLGRPYWHVFLAYALAWALVFGWAVSILRRLARVEEHLGGGNDDGS